MIYNSSITIYTYSETKDDYGQVHHSYSSNGTEYLACFQPLRFRERDVMYAHGIQADFVVYTNGTVSAKPGDLIEVTHMGQSHACDVLYVEWWDNHTKIYARYIQRTPEILEH